MKVDASGASAHGTGGADAPASRKRQARNTKDGVENRSSQHRLDSEHTASLPTSSTCSENIIPAYGRTRMLKRDRTGDIIDFVVWSSTIMLSGLCTRIGPWGGGDALRSAASMLLGRILPHLSTGCKRIFQKDRGSGGARRTFARTGSGPMTGPLFRSFRYDSSHLLWQFPIVMAVPIRYCYGSSPSVMAIPHRYGSSHPIRRAPRRTRIRAVASVKWFPTPRGNDAVSTPSRRG